MGSKEPTEDGGASEADDAEPAPASPVDEAAPPPSERVEALEDEVQTLQARVDELEEDKEELTDALARAKADYQNYRKRAKRERREATRDARVEMVGILAEVVDNVHRALDADPGPEVEKGLDLVLAQIERELDDLGVEELAPEPGDPFDPSEHEAVLTEPTDEHDPETVIERLQPGYELDGRKVRPAMVKVAAKPEAEDAPGGASRSEDSEEE